MARVRAIDTRVADADPRLTSVEAELDRWRERAIPDPAAPLDADDVARLVRDCFESLGAGPAAESFSVNTVHYYRRKDILDEPVGRTSSARYALRHVWQAAGARLAGFLGLVTLAEARESFRDADEPSLRRFVAARVADARGREATRQASPATVQARPLAAPTSLSTVNAIIVPLGDNAMCLIPATHAALRAPSAARALVASLSLALGLDS